MQSNRRTRSSIACTRCKRRKTKCNGELPVCSPCQRSGSNCTWPAVSQLGGVHMEEQFRLVQHASQLEKQVAELKRRLEAQQENETCPPEVSPHTASPIGYNGDLSTDVVLLSMNAAAEPSFVGATSGFSLSRLVGGILSQSIRVEEAGGQDITVPNQALLPEISVVTDQEAALFQTFFQRVHPRYPFLDKDSLYGLLQSEDGENDHSDSDHFLLYMIYAIGARTVQLHPEMHRYTSPETYLNRALHHIDSALASQSLRRVQALLLIATYLLRTPNNLSNLGSWHIIGLAVRHAVEMGLHRNLRGSRGRQCTEEEGQLRNRVFWSAYILDRAVSLTLGRPFALAEHEIDVPVHDSTEFRSFAHMCHLRRLESRIHREVFGADVKEVSDEKLNSFKHELDAWRLIVPVSTDANAPGSSVYDTAEFFDIQYSKALRMLLQRRITEVKKEETPSQAEEYLALSARAAGNICQHYKALHQRSPLGWNLLALHSIFTAGLTILYSTWVRKERPDLATLGDISACSSVLFAISEQWPSTKRVRDIFEALTNELMQILKRSQIPNWDGLFSVEENAFGGESFWSMFDDLVDDDYIRDHFRFDEMWSS